MKIIVTPVNTFEGLMDMCDRNTEKIIRKFNKQAKTNRGFIVTAVVLSVMLVKQEKKIDELTKEIKEMKETKETKEQKETAECD